MGMCHTPDQNASPPQLYNQAVDWWNENRAAIGNSAAQISTGSSIIPTGFLSTIPFDEPLVELGVQFAESASEGGEVIQ